MNALINVKSPARCSNTGTGLRRPAAPKPRKEQVSMTISVAGGVARPHLYAVGSNPGPAFEVPERVDGHQLAAALNALREGQIAPLGEVDGFHLLLAATAEQSFDLGFERALAGVS